MSPRALNEELGDVLRAEARRFGPLLAQTAYQRGLAVTDKADGSTKAIPITATPVLISKAELGQRQRLASRLASAGARMARAVLAGSDSELLLGALSPLERTYAQAQGAHLETLITTRVDFFVGKTVQALELNATIPAMQGYSDIAANTFIEVVGRHFGAPDHLLAKWQASNGSNALALFRALVSGYQKLRPGQFPEAIALVCRRNDAQLTEQQFLCERFRELGVEADVVHPDQLSGADAVRANGKAYPLVYRHVFVRRLEEPDLVGGEYLRALLAEPNGTRAVVLNPPASQVEVKTAFALLSQALEDQALAKEAGLTPDELSAIEEAVPWTRTFRGPELLAAVADDPDGYVLKRAWDYGGRAVFVGRSQGTPGFLERTQAAYGAPLDWKALCARALEDRVGGGFVVQRLVETNPEAHLLCSATSQEEVGLYVDFSAYASVGLDAEPAWGGVVRGSLSQIVNIVGGGGVVPLITEEVGKSLLDAWRAWR